MHYFVEDMLGLVAATPLALFLILMPGFGIAKLLGRAGVLAESGSSRACWGLVLGPALVPAVDALLLRWTGFPGAILLNGALAVLGAADAWGAVRRIPARWWVAVAFCWLAAAWANVDFDWNGRLYQAVTINDGVKHAAVIGALVRSGVPLHDPFFARPGISGYYYYFYIGPALIHWIGRPLIDSRMAFTAGTFATLLAFPALMLLVAEAAALIPDGRRRQFLRVLLLLCCLSGLDLLPGVWILFRTGDAYAQLDWWSEEVRWALTSVLWVPHHITAIIAVFAGCVVLAVSRERPLLGSIVAGIAFATAFGASSWIAIAAVPILLLWWLYDRLEARTVGMWQLPASGIVALIVSIPQIVDIRKGRTMSGAPLGFYMRPVGPIRVLPHGIGQWIAHLAVVPGGYLIEFGIFGLGAILFLARGRLTPTRATSIGRLLLVSAPVSLLTVTFVRSTVMYNDFGWRSVWLAELPALLWTASVLSARPELLKRSPLWSAAFALGLAAVAWDLAGLRLIRPYFFSNYVNANPQVDYDMRGAYQWADRSLPATMLIQHNPVQAYRALDFGLYSDRPVPVADVEAQLFGANYADVKARIDDVTPIFDHPVSRTELQRRAAAAGAGALLLTSADALWRASGGPPSDWTCVYRSPHTCIMVVEKPQ